MTLIRTPISSAERDPARELVIVGNVANNPLAFLNDPLGTGHEANVIDALAWDADKKELHIFIFAGEHARHYCQAPTSLSHDS